MSQAWQAELAAIVGPAGLISDPTRLASHNTDSRGRYHGAARWVVQPANREELSAVLRLCYREAIPIVPQGGNTSQCGAATPRPGHDPLILSLSRMKRILEIDPDNATLSCEAGAVLADIQSRARESGLLFPLSLASEGSAQVGGVISTNAGGTAVLRYGTMRSLVLGLEVVLADGRIWNGLRGLRKDNTGYDLKQWFIGAEGTLGIISRAVLRLYPLPCLRATAWASVQSPAAAVGLLRQLSRRTGERITAFELISRPALDLVLSHIPGTRAPLADPAPWSVLVELDDSLPDGDPSLLLEQGLSESLAQGWIVAATLAVNEAQADAFWHLRESVSEAQRREGVSIKHDLSVPVSRIPDFLERADRALEEAFPGIRVVCFGHVGDGNLHYNLSFADPQKNRTLISLTSEVNRIVHDIVDGLGGSISAEHGIGQLKVGELERYKDPLDLELMRGLKNLLDPRGLLNPGKVLRSNTPG